MFRVGLTGGIGSGKSTVARLLARRGATVIDGDQLAREVVEPGSPVLTEIVREFGAGILAPDGALDRAGLAQIVFPEPARLAALNRIMHPAIFARASDLTEQAARRGDRLVIHDMPLIVELDRVDKYDLLVVVTAPEHLRLQRLISRGVGEGDARNRMARQASESVRMMAADVVVDNSGDMVALAAQVDAVWDRILGLAAARAETGNGETVTGAADVTPSA